MSHGVLIHETIDDVGVAVRDLHAGEEVGVVTLEGQEHGGLKVVTDVPLGHKVAMRDMPAGHKLLKYGRTHRADDPGDPVRQPRPHAQPEDDGLEPGRGARAGDRPEADRADRHAAALSGKKPQEMKLMGYRRPDGRFGVRNHVIILPIDDISNAAANGVAALIKGTMALPHPYGRLQFGEDLELTFRTLAGTGRNPNVAAAVVIGIEPKWTQRIVDAIAETGKPVAGFSIERYGDLKTIEMAARKAMEFVQYATELPARAVHRRPAVHEHQVRRVGHDVRSGLRTRPSAACSSGWRMLAQR